jgi:hypothetical protein
VGQSCRALKRTPTFTLVAVLALGLGIGANGAIFSLVNATVLVRPPFPDPDRLVLIVELVPGEETQTGAPIRSSSIRSSDLKLLVANSRTLADVGMYRQGSVLVEHSARAAVVARAVTLPSLFSVLRVPAALGRTLQPEDGLPGAEEVAVLSHAAWDRWFGRTPNVLDQRLSVDGQPHRVVGVMPMGFRFTSAEVWTPLILGDLGRGVNTFNVLARLRPDASLAAAAQDTNTVMNAIRRRRPNPSAPPRFTVSRLQEEQSASLRPALRILSVAVFLVLLIVCSNVANLVLARSAARTREMAVRWALGAGRARLIQYLLTESVVLGLLRWTRWLRPRLRFGPPARGGLAVKPDGRLPAASRRARDDDCRPHGGTVHRRALCGYGRCIWDDSSRKGVASQHECAHAGAWRDIGTEPADRLAHESAQPLGDRPSRRPSF